MIIIINKKIKMLKYQIKIKICYTNIIVMWGVIFHKLRIIIVQKH